MFSRGLCVAGLSAALLCATPAEAGALRCWDRILNWISGPRQMDLAKLQAAAARKASKSPALTQTWTTLEEIDPLVAAWMVNHMQGIESLPLGTLPRLLSYFSRPSMRAAMAATTGPIHLGLRAKVRSWLVDFLPSGSVVGTYSHFPFRDLIVAAETREGLPLLPEPLVVQFAIRTYAQLASDYAYFHQIRALYDERMVGLALTSQQIWDLRLRQSQNEMTGFTREQLRLLDKQLKERFLSPTQAYCPAKYFAEGLLAYFQEPTRLAAIDPPLYVQLESAFAPDAQPDALQ